MRFSWMGVSACVLVVAFGTSCSGSGAAPEAEAEAEPEAEPEAEAEVDATCGPRPSSWVERRVAAARGQMEASEGGRLVAASIEAHGGLESWLAKSTLSFEFDYQPLGAPERRMHTLGKIDFWSARAWQQELEGGAGEVATMGWDGETAWITPAADAFPSPARFWALTPYYFVAMPFVAADPGTHYEKLDDAEVDGVMHHIVKLTYGEGVGDAPDDYYVLYLHPETHRLSALRYVVSYPGFFPEGGHTPEKLMRYTEYTEVDGMSFATRLDTAAWESDTATAGDVVTHITVSQIAIGETWPESLFDAPAGSLTSEIEARN